MTDRAKLSDHCVNYRVPAFKGQFELIGWFKLVSCKEPSKRALNPSQTLRRIRAKVNMSHCDPWGHKHSTVLIKEYHRLGIDVLCTCTVNVSHF
jgi:hypothetical protein